MPIQKVLVGTDFSEHSDIATQEALAIARRHGAELILLHVGVVPERPANVPSQLDSTVEEFGKVVRARFGRDRERLMELRERLAGQGPTVSQVFIEDFPDHGIPRAAKELGADLTVIGSRGLAGIRRFLLGTVAERAVRLSEGNILVARSGGNSPKGYQKVLVPVDFSDYTGPSLGAALEHVADAGELEVFHAWQCEDWGYFGSDRAALRRSEIQRGNEFVRDLRPQRDVKITFDQQEGAPKAAIEEKLRQSDYDLVVLGSHGHRGIKRWALGSVAEVTVRHAPCSVLVVHSQREGRHDHK